jgi:hypothetical protein
MAENEFEKHDHEEQTTPPQAEQQAPATEKPEESAPRKGIAKIARVVTGSGGRAWIIGGAMIPKSPPKRES